MKAREGAHLIEVKPELRVNTLRNTKFITACVTVGIEFLMFFMVLVVRPEVLDLGIIAAFLAAPTATFTAFGILNVKASGQSQGGRA